MDAGTYNVQKATCQPYCLTCDGYAAGSIDPSSFSLTVGGQIQLTFLGLWDDLYWWEDPDGDFSSENTNVRF
jgi:hypothetical protein